MRIILFTFVSAFLIMGTIFAIETKEVWNHNASDHEHIIRVGFEEAPGLIQKDGNGVLDRVLSDISKKGHINFKIVYLTYSRAKIELKKNNFDLIGLTPQRLETKNFYEFAEDLDWAFETKLVLFCNDKKDLKLNNQQVIGTPSGNEDFISEYMKISPDRFVTGSLGSVVKRVAKKRTPCFIFEEIAGLKLAKTMGIKKLFYRVINNVKASFAVSKSKGSKKLKKELEKELKNFNLEPYMKNIVRVPEGVTGVVRP